MKLFSVLGGAQYYTISACFSKLSVKVVSCPVFIRNICLLTMLYVKLVYIT